MPCYHPVQGFRSRVVNPSGKRSIVFKPADGFLDMPVTVPCGQCIGCRLERSRQWAVRCIHEAQMHTENAFITLTFDDDHLDPDGSLVKSDFQKFMKRLRKAVEPLKVRYFHCGEYGELLGRPHHHACLFGYDFPDKELFSCRDGVDLYTSRQLSALWPYGYATVGDVTFESAAYVARYVLKKVTGDAAASHYGDRVPEYVTMSRRPGIGAGWFDKYVSDVYPDDFVVVRGNFLCKPPKFYDSLYDLIDPEDCASVKRRRAVAGCHPDDQTPDRLAVREELQGIKLKQCLRGFERGGD